MKKEPSDYVNQLRDDLSRQQKRIRELEQQLAECRNGKLPADQHVDPDLISVESMVSSESFTPMVTLRWFTHVTQLDLATAKEIAFNILDGIEAAKSDAFLVNFMRTKVGADDQMMGGIIMDFRDYRAELERNKERDG